LNSIIKTTIIKCNHMQKFPACSKRFHPEQHLPAAVVSHRLRRPSSAAVKPSDQNVVVVAVVFRCHLQFRLHRVPGSAGSPLLPLQPHRQRGTTWGIGGGAATTCCCFWRTCTTCSGSSESGNKINVKKFENTYFVDPESYVEAGCCVFSPGNGFETSFQNLLHGEATWVGDDRRKVKVKTLLEESFYYLNSKC